MIPVSMVTLRTSTVQALIDTIVGRPGGTLEDVADVIGALGGADLRAFQQLLDALAGKPNATVAESSAAWQKILGEPRLQEVLDGCVGVGSAPADFVKAWEELLAQVALLSGGGLGAGLDTPAVQALIDAALAALPAGSTDLDADAVKVLIGDALAALIMPILDGHTTNINSLQTDLASVRGIVVGLVNDLSELSLGGAVQPLLDLLAVKPDATVDDVAVIWQALSNGSVALGQLLSLLSGKPLSADPTVADVQAGLPMLMNTVANTAIDASCTSGTIGNLFSQLNSTFINELQPVKDAVQLGFPHLQGQIDTSKTDLQILFYAVTGYEGATANMAGAALEAIREGLKTLDGTLNTTYDYLITVINAINGEILIGDAAIDGVGPALDKLRAESAKAQAFLNAIYKHVAGWDGNGTPPTAQQAADNLASAIIDLQTNFDSLEEIVKNGQVLEVLQELAAGIGGGATDLTGVIARLDTLEAENAALKARLDALGGAVQDISEQSAWAVEETQRLQEQDAEIVGYVVEQIAEVTTFSQGIIDAICGPNATLESTGDAFWLLNDILVALIEATGIEIQGRV